MVYGLKRGIKDPGEFTVIDVLGLSAAGATGIIAALFTDFQQKGEASALFTINHWLATMGKYVGVSQPPLWTVLAGMVAVGAGSIFYFQPLTRQGAFAHGFGLLAVIMTMVPPDLAGGLYGMDGPPLARAAPIEEVAARTSVAPGLATSKILPEGQIDSARPVQVAQDARPPAVRGAPAYDIRLRIDAPDGLPEDLGLAIRRGDLRGRIHNAENGETYNLFRNAGGALERVGDSIFITAGVPADTETAELWVRIELNGYAIEEQSTKAQKGERLAWRITLRRSTTPMFLQRLRMSYWF